LLSVASNLAGQSTNNWIEVCIRSHALRSPQFIIDRKIQNPVSIYAATHCGKSNSSELGVVLVLSPWYEVALRSPQCLHTAARFSPTPPLLSLLHIISTITMSHHLFPSANPLATVSISNLHTLSIPSASTQPAAASPSPRLPSPAISPFTCPMVSHCTLLRRTSLPSCCPCHNADPDSNFVTRLAPRY